MSKFYSNDFSMTDEKIAAIFADLHRRVEEDNERRSIDRVIFASFAAMVAVVVLPFLFLAIFH